MIRFASLASALFLALCAPAAAQSVYGCFDLSGRIAMPSVEGAGGVFYRIDPDLHMFHAFSDETVADLAELSRTLDARGTTLIYLPVPTKALAMPDQLPQIAHDLGFDLPIATTVYDDILRRLTEAGVMTTNLRIPLRTAPEAPQSFYATDPALTSAGARRMAEAVAALIRDIPGYADLPKSRFETLATGTVELPSQARSILQRHCSINLPPVLAETFSTTRFQSGEVTEPQVFEAGAPGRIVLIGGDYTGGTVSNLAGFLAEAAGLEVVEFAVDGGGSFAAISSFLTSRAFSDAPPRFIVWTNPVFNNLASHGDAPMRELIAAAGQGCRVQLPLATGFAPNSISADLRGLVPGQRYSLFVDADGAQATQAQFAFSTRSGLTLTRQILRHPAQAPTGRFFVSMAGLGSGLGPVAQDPGAGDAGFELQSVRIDLDMPFGLNARVFACFD